MNFNPFASSFRMGPVSRFVAGSVFCLAACAALTAAEKGFVFSEDFESGSLDKAVWEARTAGKAAPSVQQGQAAHGKSALQIHYVKDDPRSYAFVVATHLPESVRSHFFGRAYVFIAPGAPAGHDVLVNAGTPGYPLSNFLEIGASGGKNVMMSYQQNAANVPRGETLTRGAAYPVGKWFCLEWEFNDHPDTITVWIDGELAGEFKDQMFKPRTPNAGRGNAAKAAEAGAETAPKAAPAPEVAAVPCDGLVKGFADFAFGFRYWGTAKEDFDIYYDDIVIDTKRVGAVK